MWEKIIYSFPIQLLLLHLRKNLLLVTLWVLLALIIFQHSGSVLGIPYLFLDPEYLNLVSWQSFFLVGVALAVFTMAFHMTTYILDGAKFRFLAVIPRPFIQFCINNGLIPLVFYICYIYAIINFQLDNEHESNWTVVHYLLGFAGGSTLTFAFLFIYFRFTNKDFFVLFAGNVEKRLRKTKISRANMLKRIKESKKATNKVVDYLDLRLRFRMVRSDLSAFEGRQLLRVFDQNHLNMVVIQTALISLIFILGFFREIPLLQLPAAASFMLLLSILTMLVGAVVFWLREWATPVAIAGIVLFNLFSNSDFLNRPHTAFGMDYEGDLASYKLETINATLLSDNIEEDKANTIKTLENWRAKFPADKKPKMVFVTTSGGGQRAALWTLKVLQEAEFVSNGQLTKHTQLITGASGGIIGAAFYRELYLQSQSDASLHPKDDRFLDQISSDNLNPIIFTLLVNDLLIRSQYFTYNNRKYLKDRGFSFEQQLNINTNKVLDKPLSAYLEPERESKIPMLLITPLITNDGRKLYISPKPISYMGISPTKSEGWDEKSQGVDFQRFFYAQDAQGLRFISALRMGATFHL